MTASGYSRDYDADGPSLRRLFDLTDRRCVVIGGGSGLGRAIAVGFAYFGADVAVLDIEGPAAAATAERVRSLGRMASAHQVDVTQLDDLSEVTSLVKGEWESIDVCLTSAGGGMRGTIFDTDPAEFHRVLELNLTGTWNAARTMGRLLIANGRGKLITISSIHGHVADPLQSAYAPAKAAVIQLTRVLALEWAKYNIQVNCLAPSHFKTRRVQGILDDPEEYARVLSRSPVGRFGEPWELVGPAVFLASDASGFVTGHSLLVDGGWTVW